MLRTKDGKVYMLNNGILRHNCAKVGRVDISECYSFCPWCGIGLKRSIRAILQLDTDKIEHFDGIESDA